jgi:transposase
VRRARWWLEPLHKLIFSAVLSSPKVVADDTTLPVPDPGRGRTMTARLWCYATDNRPWGGPGYPPPPTFSAKTARASARLLI